MLQVLRGLYEDLRDWPTKRPRIEFSYATGERRPFGLSDKAERSGA